MHQRLTIRPELDALIWDLKACFLATRPDIFRVGEVLLKIDQLHDPNRTSQLETRTVLACMAELTKTTLGSDLADLLAMSTRLWSGAVSDRSA